MNEACPNDDDLARLADGEATENRAAELRRHLAGCAPCRERFEGLEGLLGDLRAPVVRVDVDAHVARLMGRLGEVPAPAPGRPWSGAVAALPRPWPRAVGALAAVALVAATALFAPRFVPRVGEEGFQARGGGAAPSLRRDVGVSVATLSPGLTPIAPSRPVRPDATYVASYRNARASAPAYLLLFAVDAARTVHWLFPAYEKPGDDPASVELAPSSAERPLPQAAVLDRPAPGPMRLVALVTERPLHVSDIESLPPEALTQEAIKARFSGASIEAWLVNVETL